MTLRRFPRWRPARGWRAAVLVAAAVSAATAAGSEAMAQSTQPLAGAQAYPAEQIARGQALFVAQCGFCHGREATGGQAGPDLTESALVAADVRGDRIGAVVRGGRAERGMPALALSEQDLAAVVAYVHSQKDKLDAQPGRRRRVSDEDLLSGGASAEAGRAYFNGAGGCGKCHSATGDLAGIASRFRGLALLQQMLSPKRSATPLPGAPAGPAKELPVRVTVTLPTGTVVTGGLAYRDEFTIALTDADGWYHSWPTDRVKFTVTDPLLGHVALLSKYTDADMHNVYAYLMTLR